MQSINFDDGLKSFAINGDESRVIRFNPSDPDLIVRYNKAHKMLKNVSSDKLSKIKLDGLGNIRKDSLEMNFDEAAHALEETNGVIREALELMFNADVYDAVFGGQSPFASVGDGSGRFVFETFLEALKPILEDGIAEYKAESEERMGKYLKGYAK